AEHLQTGYIAHIGDRGRRLVGRLDGVVTEVRCPHRGHDGDQHDEENGSPSMAQNSERSTSHQILAFSESSRVTVSKPSHSWVARSRSPSRTPTMSCSSARRSSRATKSYIVTGPGEGGRVRLTRGWSVGINSPCASDSDSFSPGLTPVTSMAMSLSGTK